MPIITVCGLPVYLGEDQLQSLTHRFVERIVSVEELKLTEKDITIFFPANRMMQVLGEEIIIFIDGLFEKPERTPAVRYRLSNELGLTAKHNFPDALVEVIPRSFYQETSWSSATDGIRALSVESCLSVDDFLAAGIDPKRVRLRILNALERQNIATIGSLLDLGSKKFKTLRNCGARAADALKTLLARKGIQWK
jgi:hypothetical protein